MEPFELPAGKYLISKNNTLALTFTSLNAVDYSPLGDSVSLSCKIDEGVKVFLARQNAPIKKHSQTCSSS